MVKHLTLKYKPLFFISVHSGFFSIMSPWAHDMNRPLDKNVLELKAIAEVNGESWCKCHSGPAAKNLS